MVGRIDELENAHGLAASAKTDYLVAGSMMPLAQEGDDMAKPAAVSEGENAAQISPNGRYAIAVHAGAGGISVVDLDKMDVIDYFDAVGKLYVSSRKSPLIRVFNPKTLAQINQIDIGKGVAHQMVVR